MSKAKILIKEGRESLKDQDYSTLHKTQSEMMELLLGNTLMPDEREAMKGLRVEVISKLNAHEDNGISNFNKMFYASEEQQISDLKRRINDKATLLNNPELSPAYKEQLNRELHGLENVQRIANGEEYVPYIEPESEILIE